MLLFFFLNFGFHLFKLISIQYENQVAEFKCKFIYRLHCIYIITDEKTLHESNITLMLNMMMSISQDMLIDFHNIVK